jgi:5-methylcytosine-specific restriction endonuclease McrA
MNNAETWGTSRTTTSAWKKLRLAVLERDGYRCQIKGPRCAVVANIADHVIPHHLGGPDELSNLQAACGPCHRTKTAREAAAARPTRRRKPEPHPGLM